MSVETKETGKSLQTIQAALLLFGSYVFVFLLGEAVHEFGHFVTDTLWGFDVRIVLDPFGGSHIQWLGPYPDSPIMFPTIAGPLLNLTAGVLTSVLLWRKARPALLPLLLWGPSALMQEGINLSAGLLSPGSDAAWLVEWGIPGAVILILGITFLVLGLLSLCCLFPLLGISVEDSFLRKLVIVAGGMVTFLLIRALYSALALNTPLIEQAVPLVAGLLLAALIALMHRLLAPVLRRFFAGEQATPQWNMVGLAAILGAVVFSVQLIV
nr:hypothetical protein [Anaerolineae bacterium]